MRYWLIPVLLALVIAATVAYAADGIVMIVARVAAYALAVAALAMLLATLLWPSMRRHRGEVPPPGDTEAPPEPHSRPLR